MNRGNSNNTTSKSRVDRLNELLARLMGKKSSSQNLQKKSPKPASNGKFTIIVLFMLGFLWVLTGVYYIPQDTYGLIMDRGRITKLVNGITVGISKPYPFSNSVLIDASENNLSIGKDDDKFMVASSDLRNLQFNLDVTYKIVDPKIYYTKFYQEIYDSNERIKWIIMASFEQYVHSLTSTQTFDMSRVILANEAGMAAKKELATYGIEVAKINIKDLQELPIAPDVDESAVTENNQSKITQTIVSEAQNYAYNKQHSAESLTTEFKSLLPQYKTNPQIVQELLYYKMLSAIPVPQKEYKLLNLTESQFYDVANSGSLTDESGQSSSNNIRERRFSRVVDRERSFKD